MTNKSCPQLREKASAGNDSEGNGLLKLVLGLAQFLHELMERQSLRRMAVGDLSEDEVERLGNALAAQAEQLTALREQFGFTREEVNLELGPLGRLF
jgi:hypothetical protein